MAKPICRQCGEPANYVVQYRGGSGTSSEWRCGSDLPGSRDFVPGTVNAVPRSKRLSVGGWGLVLRKIAGM